MPKILLFHVTKPKNKVFSIIEYPHSDPLLQDISFIYVYLYIFLYTAFEADLFLK